MEIILSQRCIYVGEIRLQRGKDEMDALVSIIVPVYNCEKYLTKCLTSIIKQSYSCLEILVIDDGSTDKSRAIIDKMKQKDKRIISLYQENDGVASARNHALKHANGKYYLFIDGDDYIGVDYVKNLVTCAEKNQADLTICGYTLVYAESKKCVKIVPGVYRKGDKEEWAYRISAVCSRLYSSAFWDKNNLMFIKEENARAEDVPLVLVANAMAKNVCMVDKADYFYVQHRGSAMHSKGNVKFLFPYRAFEKIYLQIKNMEFENSKEFYDIGILKFLAQFEYVLYRKANRNEKKRFHTYIGRLLKDDFDLMQQEWKMHKRDIEFPLTHKLAISLFCWNVRKYF